jgi:hypothetical protein
VAQGHFLCFLVLQAPFYTLMVSRAVFSEYFIVLSTSRF